MILWRISTHTHLDGAGGLRAPGRWHTRGRRIVYCAPDPATALLEVLAHAEIDVGDIPTSFRYLQLEAPDWIGTETVDLNALGPNWKDDLPATRRWGDRWLRSASSGLLKVPSVIVPATWNVLINPLHPDSAHIRIARMHEHPLDPRLLARR